MRNEPIQARPPSVAYRLKKLGQRHRATILTVCAVTLLVAIAVSTIEALRASRADKAAVAEQPGLMLDSKEAEEQEGPFSQRLERYKSMDIGEEKMVNMMALLGPFFYITNPSYAKEIKDGRVVPLVVPDETGSKIIINMEEVIKTIARDAITFPLLPAAQVQEMNEHTVVDEDTRYRLYRHTCQLKLLGDIQAAFERGECAPRKVTIFMASSNPYGRESPHNSRKDGGKRSQRSITQSARWRINLQSHSEKCIRPRKRSLQMMKVSRMRMRKRKRNRPKPNSRSSMRREMQTKNRWAKRPRLAM